jgi:hypothetical protein
MPRVSSELELTSLVRQQLRSQPSAAADPLGHALRACNQTIVTAAADGDTNGIGGKPPLPYMLPTNKMGFRLCGCHESKACIHKDPETGKPLPSHEAAYRDWRIRTDQKAMLAMVVWFLARRLPKEQTLLRRCAAILVQLVRFDCIRVLGFSVLCLVTLTHGFNLTCCMPQWHHSTNRRALQIRLDARFQTVAAVSPGHSECERLYPPRHRVAPDRLHAACHGHGRSTIPFSQHPAIDDDRSGGAPGRRSRPTGQRCRSPRAHGSGNGPVGPGNRTNVYCS